MRNNFIYAEVAQPIIDEYNQILSEYSKVTKITSEPLEPSRTQTTHQIATTGPPLTARARRLTGDKYKAARTDFDRLLDEGSLLLW